MKLKLIFFALLSIYGKLTFSQPQLALDTFSTGFQLPVDIENAGDGRLFIVEKSGRVLIVDSTGQKFAKPFLDISFKVKSSGNEQGLLGLVFDPNYASNGLFYINYTDLSDNTQVEQYQVSSNPDSADINSSSTVISINQPFTNHNAGDLAFGPDGYLYIALGDGGSGGDPGDRSQDGSELLGKVLRLDVTNLPYSVPPDNPFLNDSTVKDEIWALGLRNPWRYSFDSKTGQLWIADVGQNAWEEVSVADSGDNSGLNFGWRCFEGNHPYNTVGCNAFSFYDSAIFEYSHNFTTGGLSITGGFVYRGSEFTNLQGYYVCCDFASGNFWTVNSSNYSDVNFYSSLKNNVSSFGQDKDGELYACTLNDGIIYRIKEQCATYKPTVSIVGGSLISSPASSYQWYVSGVPIAGATGRLYTPNSNGFFAVRTDTINNCSILSDSTFFSLNSIESSRIENQIKVFPNPIVNHLSYESRFGIKNLLIVDSRGLVVMERNAIKKEGVLHLSHISSGCYVLVLQTDHGTIRKNIFKF